MIRDSGPTYDTSQLGLLPLVGATWSAQKWRPLNGADGVETAHLELKPSKAGLCV